MGFNFLGVVIITIFLIEDIVASKVLNIMSIFMDDGLDHQFNIPTFVIMDLDMVANIIILSIPLGPITFEDRNGGDRS